MHFNKKIPRTFIIFFIYSNVLLSHFTQSKYKQIRLYALCTPSHRIFLDKWFLPSIKDDYTVIVERIDNSEGKGTFRDDDWFKAVEKKVDLIIRAIIQNRGKVFVFSDVDITFYRKTWPEIEKALHKKDIVFQQDNPSGMICTGFFGCRANRRTLRFWLMVKNQMRLHKNQWHDQTAVNHILRGGSNSFRIRWGYLPVKFFSGGTLTGKFWSPGDDLPVPKEIILHHANFTRGTANKIKQLEMVNERVNTNKP